MTLPRPIETYDDYRDVVRDWFLAEKSASPVMSYRFLARRLGLSAPNHLHLVAGKKRHLSRSLFAQLKPMLKLKPRERSVFELLFETAVDRNHARRAAAWEKLARLRATRRDGDGEDYSLLANSIAWFLVMGAPLFDGLSRAEASAKARAICRFPTTEGDVTAAFDFLLRQGKLKETDGRLVFPTEHYRTGWDLDRDEIRQFHRANLRLAQQSVSWPPNERFHSNVTFLANRELLEAAKQEIRDLCMKLLGQSDLIAAQPGGSVVALQFALFPFFES